MGPRFSTEKVHAHKAYDNEDFVDARKTIHGEQAGETAQPQMLLLNLNDLNNIEGINL